MKYQGGKFYQKKYIVPKIIEIMEKYNIQKYYEPFVGGANIITWIPEKYERFGSDINKYIIAFYDYCAKGGQPLEDVSKEEYDNYKANIDKTPDWIIGNIGTTASYGGKWLDSYAKDNASRQHYYKSAMKNVYKEIPHWKTIHWECKEYTDIIFPEDEKVLIYNDAPYINTASYKNSVNFDDYYKWLREISKKHYVLISEFTMPDDFIPILSKKRLVSLHTKKNALEKMEYLFIHKDGLLSQEVKNEI